MPRHWRIAIMVLAAGAGMAMSQPPQDQPPPDRPDARRPEGRQPEDRESYKARLERSLADNKRRQERLEAALKKLNEGASVEEVRRETEGPRPPQGMRDPRSGRGLGRPGDRGPDALPTERLSRDEVISLIEANNPDVGARFRKALADNPSMAGRLIDRLEPMVREIKAERDPDMRKLRMDDLRSGFELVGATRAYYEAFRADADSEATKTAAAKLRTLLGEHFDIRVSMHRQEIVMLERRLTQLREDLSKQLEDRESFVERRMEDVKRFRGRDKGDGRPGGPSESDGRREPQAGESKPGEPKPGQPKR